MKALANVAPDARNPRQIAARFRALVQRGALLRPAGTAREDPLALLSAGYTPRYRVDLFDTSFFLTNLRREDQFRFFVAYVRLAEHAAVPASQQVLWPRIFYKDSSLVWRAASHFIATDDDQWIGKGALKPVRPGDREHFASAEETTNLPLEIQAALDELSRRGTRAREDKRAIGLILRQGPANRVRPYADFSGPRKRAMARPGGQINGGRYVAWFDRADDPASLRFAPGFEPDLRSGLIDTSHLRSRLYGGAVTKFRILAKNGQIQYQFIAGSRHVWIIPPQALTRELMSFGLRTVDVEADENLFLPGYEFHYPDCDVDSDSLHSQIPPGFAGAPSALDPSRADTSPWNDQLPVIRAFRRAYL